jgi:vacuolar-type H+-ATPase subunit E/Vma4
MALSHILAAIRRDGAEECARIEAHAQAEAERLLAEAEARGAARGHETLRAAEDAIAAERERLKRRVASEDATLRRQLRGRALAVLLSCLDQQLGRLRDDAAAFRRLSARLLDQALAALPDADTVAVDARDEELVRELLRERGRERLAVRPDLSTWGGITLEHAGVHRVVNTLEARRRAAAEALVRIAVTMNPALRVEP